MCCAGRTGSRKCVNTLFGYYRQKLSDVRRGVDFEIRREDVKGRRRQDNLAHLQTIRGQILS